MSLPAQSLVQALVHGDGVAQRRAMAKAITLLESSLSQDRQSADEMLTALLPHTGNALRLGVSGVPGVGKSTFIEALGLFLIEQGKRVAVLAVDPSSVVSGGSILGDKTRMERLSVHPKAFIRPSPSGGNLGGVAERTRESMLVCEAAGYDIVMVETVGVGQSEIAVAGMTDLFILMQLPNAGDELQAIKRGIMEMADLVLINKADLDADAALRAQSQLVSTLRILAGSAHARRANEEAAGEVPWSPQVMAVSALHGAGIEDLWTLVRQFSARTQAMQERRKRQSLDWLAERVESGLKQWFWSRPGMQEAMRKTQQAVLQGEMAASSGARQMLALALSLDSGGGSIR